MSFGDDASDHLMRFVLDQHETFQNQIERANRLRAKYLEISEQTGEVQYEEAYISFEDMAANLTDYDVALLEEAYDKRRDYDIPGFAGLQILRILVEKEPDRFVSELNIATDKFVELSSTDWLVWHCEEAGFESIDFDDREWRFASRTGFPPGTNLGILDSLGAEAIWFRMEPPAGGAPTEGEFNLFEGLEEEPPPDSTGESGEAAAEEEEPPEEVGEGAEPTREDAEIDSLWRMWMGVDSTGARTYWFRWSFYADEVPSTGHIYITADDDFNLFLNGVYIAEDERGRIDWEQVEDYDVGPYLKDGRNVIAVKATDVDRTGYGFAAALLYESIPDLQTQLDRLIEEEAERQQRRREERLAALQAEEMKEIETEEDFWSEAGVGAEGSIEETGEAEQPPGEEGEVVDESGEPELTPEELMHEWRTIERNKMR